MFEIDSSRTPPDPSRITYSKVLRTIDNTLRLLPILLQDLTQLHHLLVQQIDIHLLSRNYGHPIHTIAVAIDLLLLLSHG